MRYRFWLICINYNFDFLVLYKMYFQNYFARRSIILESFTSHLQHSRPCCIRYTNSRLRLEFVYLIQHGRSYCKYYIITKLHTYYTLVVRLFLNVEILVLDPVYTVPDSHSHDIEFGQFEVIFTLATFSMISCY